MRETLAETLFVTAYRLNPSTPIAPTSHGPALVISPFSPDPDPAIEVKDMKYVIGDNGVIYPTRFFDGAGDSAG